MTTTKKFHSSITFERIHEALSVAYFGLDFPGICVECGADTDGCAPDDPRVRLCRVREAGRLRRGSVGLYVVTAINVEKGKRVMTRKIHASITAERVQDAIKNAYISLDNPGFCIACGADADGCEPDAREYVCEDCGERAVYGAEELLFMM